MQDVCLSSTRVALEFYNAARDAILLYEVVVPVKVSPCKAVTYWKSLFIISSIFLLPKALNSKPANRALVNTVFECLFLYMCIQLSNYFCFWFVKLERQLGSFNQVAVLMHNDCLYLSQEILGFAFEVYILTCLNN